MSKHLILLAAIVIICASGVSQTKEQRDLIRDLDGYFNGLHELPKDNYSLKDIYAQLVKYSGVKVPAFYVNSLPGRQAHRGGIILLDESILRRPKDMQAFFLAHEWGHIALNHEANLDPVNDTAWQHRPDTLNEEADADAYAGSFLRANGYDITNLKDYLSDLAGSSGSQSSRYDRVVEGAEAPRHYANGAPILGKRDLIDTCPECDGSGWARLVATCLTCNGSGVLTCRACKGVGGFYTDNDLTELAGNGESWVSCSKCSGKKVVTCLWCEGKGVRNIGKNKCAACDGTGEKKQTQ